MTINEMNEIKESRGYSFSTLSDYTGVPIITLQRIFNGTTKNPRKATLDAIEKVLIGDERIYSGKALEYEEKSSAFLCESDDVNYYTSASEQANVLRDTGAPYRVKKDGEYTIEDYYALPDDKRVELIDGRFYDMTAPKPVHQIISSTIFGQISRYIVENKGTCIPMYSPIDVQLDCDDITMVQPDIIVVCDESKIKDSLIYGAPDFIVEIISPSTRRKDMFVKAEKYNKAGVKEYWMVDPKKRILIVYNYMDEDVAPVIVPLEGEFPIMIYDGKLSINLGEVAAVIDRFS